jgi:hypothetical protein
MANLDQLLNSLSYTNSGEITSKAIICALSVGAIASPAFTVILKKTQAYKKIISICTIFFI